MITETKFTRCRIDGKKSAVVALSDSRAAVLFYGSTLGASDSDAVEYFTANSFHSFTSARWIPTADAAGLRAVLGSEINIAWAGSAEFAAYEAAAAGSRPGGGNNSRSASASTVSASAVSAPAVATSDAPQESNSGVELPTVDAEKVLNDALSVAVGGLAPMVAGSILPAVNAWASGLVDEVAKTAVSAGPVVDIIRVIDGAEVREIPGLAHLELAKCVNLAKAGIHIYLHGPAGTGKTTLCKQVAAALGRPFFSVAKVGDEWQLSGMVDAHGKFIETECYRAVVAGGVLLVDEADASDPNALTWLNSGLANGFFTFPGVGRVEAAPGFLCIMTGNTIGRGASSDYVGRNPLDLATLDRFAFVAVGYDERIETALANGDADLVNFIHEVRRACEASGVQCLATPRALSGIAKMRGVFSPSECLNMFLLKGLEKDQISVLASECSGRGVWFDALRELAA